MTQQYSFQFTLCQVSIKTSLRLLSITIFTYANSTQHQHFTMPVIFSQILKFDRDTNLLCNSQLYILAQMSLHICLTNLELLETWASQMRKIGFEVEDDVEDV